MTSRERVLTALNHEEPCIMRGIENCLADMLGGEDFFTALITRTKSMAIPAVRVLLKEAGPYVDVLVTGDDLGTQESTLMSPAGIRFESSQPKGTATT